MNPRLHFASVCVASVQLPLVGEAVAQYCPVATHLFQRQLRAAGCTVGTCWAPNPFTGSTPITGTYPSTNYACARRLPAAGRVGEHALWLRQQRQSHLRQGPARPQHQQQLRRPESSHPGTRSGVRARPSTPTTEQRARQVTDPRNLVTTYTMNGFGETTTLASPDTGSATSTYDPAGNLRRASTRAGSTATTTYDALNRATQVVYSKSGTPTETHTFTYDRRQRQGPAHHAHRYRRDYQLDLRGTRPGDPKTQTVGYTKTVGYVYNAAGQLANVDHPLRPADRLHLQQQPHCRHHDQRQPAHQRRRPPSRSVRSTWQWGNGLVLLRDYDNDGRLPRGSTATAPRSCAAN